MDNASITAEPSLELTLGSSLHEPTSHTLECCAAAINAARGKTIEAIFEIGAQLQIAHDELAHNGDGLFGKWVKEQCGMSRSAAYDAMRLVEVFGAHQAVVCPPGGQTFDVKSLYLLSRDTTPKAAINEALRLAKAGEHVTLGCAKKLVAAHTIDQAAGDDGPVPESASHERDWADFESTMRDEILSWREVCPLPDRASMPEALRRIANELEALLGMKSGNPNNNHCTAAAAAEQPVKYDITFLSKH